MVWNRQFLDYTFVNATNLLGAINFYMSTHNGLEPTTESRDPAVIQKPNGSDATFPWTRINGALERKRIKGTDAPSLKQFKVQNGIGTSSVSVQPSQPHRLVVLYQVAAEKRAAEEQRAQRRKAKQGNESIDWQGLVDALAQELRQGKRRSGSFDLGEIFAGKPASEYLAAIKDGKASGLAKILGIEDPDDLPTRFGALYDAVTEWFERTPQPRGSAQDAAPAVK